MKKKMPRAAGAMLLALVSLAAGFGAARAESLAPTGQGAAEAQNAADAPVVRPLLWNATALARMAEAAARYARISTAGGWPLVADGPSLHENDVDPSVTVLRRRLVLAGDLPDTADTAKSPVYDRPLADAVRRFQARHGLVADGIVGRETRAALNVTAPRRAAQLALNRDRLDRLALELPATGIVVNLPAATLQLDRDGRTVLLSRAVVGTRSWRTPLVASTVYEVETNPYWNVPTRIARLELLPQIRKDPGYLAKHNMRVLTAAGKEIAASAVDWSQFFALGYRLRQDPGPDNPMGALKFAFDNPYAIYIHDTPGKASFTKSTRAFSHGCVRIEQPRALATQLLAVNSTAVADSLDAAIASGETKHITLARPMPVRTVYVTAWVGGDGVVQFRPDIYGYDAAELGAHEAKVAACSVPATVPAG